MQRMQSWQKVVSAGVKFTALSCIGIGALISTSTQALAQYATYYVNPVSGSDTADGSASSPFKTIQKAQSVVRTRNAAMTGDIKIYLSGGTYPLTSNLTFQASDSGFNGHRVIYLAQPYTAPIVTGAKNITGWTQYNSAKNIWSASARGMNFRQLYINGVCAIRARTTNYQGANDLGPYSTGLVWKAANKTISVPSSNLSPGWNGLTSTVEMVINRHWQTVRTKIASVAASGSNFEITPTTATQNILWNTPYAQFLSPKPTYYFENSLDFLDAPGEFYLDTAANKVYYIPRSGEQANLNNTNYVMAPGISRILDVNGASNISFQWITFEGSNYLPADGSMVELQSNFMFKPTAWQTQAIPGGVRVRNASGVHLQYCTVRRMGGAGIEFTDSTNGCIIDHGNVYDVAGNGIEIYTDVNNVPGKGSVATSHTSINDQITNTFVHEVGRDYSGASGIIATYPKDITINHNEIYNCPYNGISLGWGWTSSATSLGGNKVNYNNVHHVMQLHDDAAGIYTLSLNSPQSEIAYNYIHDISRSGWAELNAVAGIYFDEGSSGFNAHNNSIDPLIRQKLNYNVPATGNGITISGNDTTDPTVIAGAGPVDYAPAQGGPTVVPNTAVSIAGGFDSYLQSGCFMPNGGYILAGDYSCFTIMQSDGNLVLYKGSGPLDNKGYVWSSGLPAWFTQQYPNYNGPTFAKVTFDAHVQTWTGTPSNPGVMIWSSASSGPANYYFLRLNYNPSNLVLSQGYGSGSTIGANGGWTWDSYNVGH